MDDQGMAGGDTDPHFVLHSSSHRHGRDGTCAKRHRTRRTEVPTRGASTKPRRNEAKDDMGERERDAGHGRSEAKQDDVA